MTTYTCIAHNRIVQESAQMVFRKHDAFIYKYMECFRNVHQSSDKISYRENAMLTLPSQGVYGYME